jgi:FkbM family methyltransferase
MEPQFNGQLMQDKIVHEVFFQNLQNGTYVDIGASDGITISNTKFYDDIGWSGICVEPIPDVYRKLCFNRPNAITVWGAAYNRDGTETFRANTGYTAELSGIESAYDPQHVQRIEYEQQKHGGISEMIEVPTFTITSLLRKHKINKVDYMSMMLRAANCRCCKESTSTPCRFE